MKTPHAIAEIWKQLHDVTAERDALEARNRQLEAQHERLLAAFQHRGACIERLEGQIAAVHRQLDRYERRWNRTLWGWLAIVGIAVWWGWNA